MELIVKNLTSYLLRAQQGEDTILAPRQLETVEKIRDFIAAGHTAGLVVKPTGIGKTVIFAKFVEAALANSKARALIVGPTKIILHQNRWKLDAFADIAAGTFGDGQKDLSRQVTVTTYHSLRNAVKRGLMDPKDYQILILDEAHRALGEETIAVVDQFEKSIRIGFTATPEFHEERSVADILPYRIDEMSVREAIQNNLLAGLRVFVMTTGHTTGDVAVGASDFEEESLTKAINTPERNSFVAQLYRREEFYGKRTVVYAASRVHGRALTAAFEKEGVTIAYVDGETPEAERESIFEKFKRAEIPVLCNVRVLVEGFDEPEAEICFNACPTMSKVIAEQRGGRILRRSRLRDSKIGTIVEILDEFGGSANTPVLFSEIAGAVEILAPSNIKEAAREKVVKPRKVVANNSKPKPGTLIDDPEVIMQLTNRNRRQRFTKMFEYAPNGWTHARRLAHELHIKESEVRMIAEVESAPHPEWFKRFLTPLDILLTHYHPALGNMVRCHFVPELRHLVTPGQFAEIAVLQETRATELLEAADDQAPKKAIRYSDETYYCPEVHEVIIRTELDAVKVAEDAVVQAAEDAYWSSEEETDEERELTYWEAFEPITSESKGVDVEHTELETQPEDEKTDSFDDDTHQAFIQDEPSVPLLSGEMRLKVREWLTFIPPRCKVALEELYFNDLTQSGAARKIGTHANLIRESEERGLKCLRSRSRMLFMWDCPLSTDDDLLNTYYTPKKDEHLQIPPEKMKVLRKMVQKYVRQPCYYYKDILS
jgi:superfamily II DNA or RNA helicase/DNA-directed RNA polymerase specialized sigma24 family protein